MLYIFWVVQFDFYADIFSFGVSLCWRRHLCVAILLPSKPLTLDLLLYFELQFFLEGLAVIKTRPTIIKYKKNETCR
jgi:hypothetical protein